MIEFCFGFILFLLVLNTLYLIRRVNVIDRRLQFLSDKMFELSEGE